jgi:hypothetical protein
LLVLPSIALLGLAVYATATAPQHRFDRWCEELAAEIAAEKARPAERRVPREPAVEGELYAAIDSALAVVPAPTHAARSAWMVHVQQLVHGYASRWSPAWRPPSSLLTPELVAAGARVSPFVEPLRASLRSNRVTRAFDPEAVRSGWKNHHATDWPRLASFVSVSAGFTLAALNDVEARHPADAARSLVDLWQLAHEVGGREGLFGLMQSSVFVGPECVVIAMATIPGLDEQGVAALDEDLRALEASEPSFARAAERDLLVLRVALRKGGLVLMRPADAQPSRLDRLGPVHLFHRLTEIDSVEALYRRVAETASLAEPWRGRAALEGLSADEYALWGETRWELSCTGDHNGVGHDETEALAVMFDDQLIDRATLRLARLLIAARRFARTHDRWPSSQGEALGREPLSEERDPFNGEPLRVITLPDGSLLARTTDFETEMGLGRQNPRNVSLVLPAPTR